MPYTKNDPVARERHRLYMQQWYQKNKQKHIKMVRRVNKRNKDAGILLILEFRRNGCAKCDETEPCCMSAHHLDSNDKDFNIGGATSRRKSAKQIAIELAKCICLCENCHRKLHAGIIKL